MKTPLEVLDKWREALEELYTSLPDILPAHAHERFLKTGKWSDGSEQGCRGMTETVTYRVEDMQCVYAALDQALALLATSPEPSQNKEDMT